MIRCWPRFEFLSETGALSYDNDKYICKVWVYALSWEYQGLVALVALGLVPASKGRVSCLAFRDLLETGGNPLRVQE